MNIKNLIPAILFLLPCLAFAVDPITADEHQKLMKGESLQVVTWEEGYVWPKVFMRVVLNNKPQENMEVFMDFDSHKTFVPDMLESKVVKKVSPENMHVMMSMAMPWPVKKSTHTTNNVLVREADGSLTLKWSLVSAEFLKATDGYVTFKPYMGKTLMEYMTFIVPNSSFAGMFKNQVAGDVKKTVEKIAQHLNKTTEGRRAPASVVHGSDGKNKL